MPDPADLIAAARKLVEAVSFDVNGIMGRGGNGGLTWRLDRELTPPAERFRQFVLARQAGLAATLSGDGARGRR